MKIKSKSRLRAKADQEQKQIKSKSRSRAKADQEQKQIKSKSRSRAKADQEQKQIKGFPAEAGPTVEVSLTFERAHALRGYASLDALRPSAADGGC
jgi:hypothetical protein